MRRDGIILLGLLVLFLACWSSWPVPPQPPVSYRPLPEPPPVVLPPPPDVAPPSVPVTAPSELPWPVLNLPEWQVIERQQRRWLQSPTGMVWDWPPTQPLVWRNQEWFFLAVGAPERPVFVAYPLDAAVITRQNEQGVVIQWLTDGSTLRVDATGRVQAQPPSQRMFTGVEP